MIWKVIGSSCIGSSHIDTGGNCEDSITIKKIIDDNAVETLICCVSDGAGSAKFGGQAAKLITEEAVNQLTSILSNISELEQINLYEVLEKLHDLLTMQAASQGESLNEFSCTCLGSVITEHKALFFQIGDGAIVREDNCGGYIPIFWPENGEYSNTTTFLVDDSAFPALKYKILNESVQEIAMFTDGLQMLALNYETSSVYFPFFENLFRWLRMVKTDENLQILQGKLEYYLQSDLINARTNDDKTLFLATRKSHDTSNV